MPCPQCVATATVEQPRRTALGYRTFRCGHCRRIFNERTGTPYNHLQYPTDLMLLIVLWRLRYKLSLRDLAEMFLARGFAFSHETVRDWEARFAPLLADRLRTKRRGQGTVKLSTFDGSDDRKVGSNPRLRAMISLQAQHLRAIIRPRWGGFVQLKLKVTVP